MAKRHYYEEDDYQDDQDSVLALTKDIVHRELKDIGLDRVAKLEKLYGKDDIRTKKAKVESFFRAYGVVGTVHYAAQIVGVSPKVMNKLIKSNDSYRERFELAHEEFTQHLEQVAIMRALKKSDTLLMFLLRANNPRKFSERMRIQALDKEDDTPLTLHFGEYDANWEEPNYLHVTSLERKEEKESDEDE